MDTDALTPLMKMRGRGASENPPNRFEKLHLERDEEWTDADPARKTEFYRDASQSILAFNNSPDLGFDASLNPYRGCEHGCIYCYARPTHEYLGFSAGLDFESRIMVKLDAPALLEKELASKHWRPQVIVLSGNTDCYQPVERRLEITRQCLQVLAECRNPVGVITKNQLVTRDIDVFQELARFGAIHVTVSVTSLRDDFSGKLEPRASRPQARLAAIQALAQAGIPVGVNVAPIIPGLTDFEIPTILQAAREAGATWAGFTLVRLPFAVKSLFEAWLERHFSDAKNKVLNRIREVRDGKLNDANFGSRMRGEGIYARQIARFFNIARNKAVYPGSVPELRSNAFRPPRGPQLSLFDI